MNFSSIGTKPPPVVGDTVIKLYKDRNKPAGRRQTYIELPAIVEKTTPGAFWARTASGRTVCGFLCMEGTSWRWPAGPPQRSK